MGKTKKAHTAEVLKLAGELPTLIEKVEIEIRTLEERMTSLKAAGLIYASEHWRKNGDGAPKYFYLLYPQQPGQPRKREYVGCDAGRIGEARAAISRAQTYVECEAQLATLKRKVQSVTQAVQEARRILTRG